jgi:ferredoxin
MVKITLEEEIYTCQSDESVLDTLIREDVDISYSCQKGTCHSCLSRSIGLAPPEAAQKGLKDTQKRQKYFLACLCYPEEDMQIKLPDQSEIFSQGKVVMHEMLNHSTLLLKVEVVSGCLLALFAQLQEELNRYYVKGNYDRFLFDKSRIYLHPL